jgi:hypothetical protein
VGNLIWIHIINLALSLASGIMLVMILRSLKKQSFITTISVAFLFLLFNICLFTIVYTIDTFSATVLDVHFYNLWSAFIRTQNVATIFYISIIILRRIKNE